ncbi:hypothetical protein HS088_TW14G01030 [Tripterygium wilfordii]|uniref:Pre-rRNA-processing protein TSR2 n=1 Tax=Tripterygium wilfordii TaxID=458696 RepID=A0A7J7CRZ5_TRIWF|nr:pre-rRNA-processing protein TSR2 homolog [Tripterygium wilfordii]XP_038724118.1 pre-rRNA-processing protein TSR2 homolog [Tripterygium wilfordii]KAF5736875.1 hypothetical protein HS088_TW14G01030 [Tripterygium wilfordii]
MESINNGDNHFVISARPKRSDSVSRIQERIALLLSRWNGLQMAVQNQWGGRDSLRKSHQLASEIFSWFVQYKGPVCVEDLENMLFESMLFSFNTEIEDGSLEEVAEQLMTIYEECLLGNH